MNIQFIFWKIMIKEGFTIFRKNPLIPIGLAVYIALPVLCGYYLSVNYTVDRVLLKDILSVLAFGSIALLAVQNLIFFQFISSKLVKDEVSFLIHHIKYAYILFSIIILFLIILAQIASINITKDRDLFISTLVIISFYVYILYISLVKILEPLIKLYQNTEQNEILVENEFNEKQ